jgi:hypothetical protein
LSGPRDIGSPILTPHEVTRNMGGISVR